MDKNKENGPSKFAVPPFASDDEIWIKILEVLTPSEQLEASRSKSEFNDPYVGGKEIIVKRSDYSDIAVALLSEVSDVGDEWAIYREL
ncbi:hypothetical protein [Prochlorococcus sp. MIT 0801]|uniref:hypothetical protein n=1 Tax=Prochlorococcus sp. MIT 0801 TaxID=1501269 RepID=UPI0004F622C3|nr:hypothetical protein [Prochlorococcus sp. MIT 0801]AIQ97313.1 hypothetical protein EW15_1221 [Prochlorococcus sp. MIT 0801]